MLEVKELTKTFGGLRAVDNLSINVDEGIIMGLIGPNGAGKTTVFNIITGFIHPTAGEITYNGIDISDLIPEKIAKLGIVRTFQANSVFPKMSVLANVMLGFHVHARVGIFGTLFNTKQTLKREEELTAQGVEILRTVGLAEVSSKLAGSLPHGHQRALEIAIALATRPKLLLLDEPVGGMSRDEAKAMSENIASLGRKGLTVILVEHDMKTVMDLCDRVVVMNYGQKIAEGTPNEISQHKTVIEAYLGTDEE